MGLTSRETLDVINVIFYVPVLALSIFLAKKHGYRASNGWLYILALALFRIVGCSLGIAAIQNGDSSLGIAAAILNADGLSVLIQTLDGLLRRINEGIQESHQIPPRYINLITIPLIVGIVFATWGGTNMRDGDVEHYSSGQSKFKVAAIIFLLILMLHGGLVALAFVRRRYLATGELRVVLAMALALPWLLVRTAYGLCIAFAPPTTTSFRFSKPKTFVLALMSTLPEFTSVAVLLIAGILVKPSSKLPRNVDITGDGKQLEDGVNRQYRFSRPTSTERQPQGYQQSIYRHYS